VVDRSEYCVVATDFLRNSSVFCLTMVHMCRNMF